MQFLDEEWSWKYLTLYQYVQERNYPISWKNFFEKQEVQHEIKIISDNLDFSTEDIYPEINNVFRAFIIPLEKIKVVILGQDPYHDGNAVGICFSVPRNSRINPSLRNIYTELKNEGYTNIKEDGSLLHWVKQGCFMLNTALTVEKNNPNSHTALWYNFTKLLIEYISNNTSNVSWILMGKNAIEIKKWITNTNHNTFCCSHPSPFSANRNIGIYPSFLGSNIFRNVNDILTEKIVW